MFINKFCFILHVSFSKGEGRLCLYKVEVGNEKFNLSITNLLLKLCGCSLSTVSLLRVLFLSVSACILLLLNCIQMESLVFQSEILMTVQ